jgi:outer membrane protein insertion porin family
LAEGDPYNSNLLKRSKQRVENLDFFGKVDVKRERGSTPDKVDINVDVEEKSTGELNFGAGFSSTEGVLGNSSITERNFLGRGQALSLSISASGVTQQGQLSFTEPYFMDKPFAAGFDIFKVTTNEQDESSYDSDSTGFNLRGGYEVSEHLRHTDRKNVV